MTKLNLNAYDLECLMAVEWVKDALSLNSNQSIPPVIIKLLTDAINNTIDPKANLLCSGLKIEQGIFFPKIEKEEQGSAHASDYRSRLALAEELEIWDYSKGFKSIDEIREYMNASRETVPVSQLIQEYKASLEGETVSTPEVKDSKTEPEDAETKALKASLKSVIPPYFFENIDQVIFCSSYKNPEAFGFILKEDAKGFKNHKSFAFNSIEECKAYFSDPNEYEIMPEFEAIAYAYKLENDKDLESFEVEDVGSLLDALKVTSVPEAKYDLEGIDWDEDKFIVTYKGYSFELDTLDECRYFIGFNEEETWKPSAVRPEQISRRIGWLDEADLIEWANMTLDTFNRRLLMSFLPLDVLNMIQNITFLDYEPVIWMKDRNVFFFDDFEKCIEFLKYGYHPDIEDSTSSLLSLVDLINKKLVQSHKDIKLKKAISKKVPSKNPQFQKAIIKLSEVETYLEKGLLELEEVQILLKEILKDK